MKGIMFPSPLEVQRFISNMRETVNIGLVVSVPS